MSVRQEENGTWTAQVWYKDFRGGKRHTSKRGFKSEAEAREWERSYALAEGASMSMKFSQFVKVYEQDMKPRLRETT